MCYCVPMRTKTNCIVPQFKELVATVIVERLTTRSQRYNHINSMQILADLLEKELLIVT